MAIYTNGTHWRAEVEGAGPGTNTDRVTVVIIGVEGQMGGQPVYTVREIRGECVGSVYSLAHHKLIKIID